MFFFYLLDGRMPDGQGKNIMTLQLRWAGHKNTFSGGQLH